MREGPHRPRLAAALAAASRPAITALYAASGVHRAGSATTRAALARAGAKLADGATLRIVGIGRKRCQLSRVACSAGRRIEVR